MEYYDEDDVLEMIEEFRTGRLDADIYLALVTRSEAKVDALGIDTWSRRFPKMAELDKLKAAYHALNDEYIAWNDDRIKHELLALQERRRAGLE